MHNNLTRLKTGKRPVHCKSVHLFKVHYKACGQDDVWRATDGNGYQEYVRASTRYEAAVRLGILDLLKQKA